MKNNLFILATKVIILSLIPCISIGQIDNKATKETQFLYKNMHRLSKNHLLFGHSLHHTQFNYNFGLYCTFLDHWMGTESPDY